MIKYVFKFREIKLKILFTIFFSSLDVCSTTIYILFILLNLFNLYKSNIYWIGILRYEIYNIIIYSILTSLLSEANLFIILFVL